MRCFLIGLADETQSSWTRKPMLHSPRFCKRPKKLLTVKSCSGPKRVELRINPTRRSQAALRKATHIQNLRIKDLHLNPLKVAPTTGAQTLKWTETDPMRGTPLRPSQSKKCLPILRRLGWRSYSNISKSSEGIQKNKTNGGIVVSNRPRPRYLELFQRLKT